MIDHRQQTIYRETRKPTNLDRWLWVPGVRGCSCSTYFWAGLYTETCYSPAVKLIYTFSGLVPWTLIYISPTTQQYLLYNLYDNIILYVYGADRHGARNSVDNCCECDTGSCVPPAGPSCPLYPFWIMRFSDRRRRSQGKCAVYALPHHTTRISITLWRHRHPPAHHNPPVRSRTSLPNSPSENQIWMARKKYFHINVVIGTLHIKSRSYGV